MFRNPFRSLIIQDPFLEIKVYRLDVFELKVFVQITSWKSHSVSEIDIFRMLSASFM